MIVSEVTRLEQLAPEERLNPEKLMQDLKAAGKNAAHLSDVDAIVMHVSKNVQGGDVVLVFSNGGFGGTHGKLLERLGRNLTGTVGSRPSELFSGLTPAQISRELVRVETVFEKLCASTYPLNRTQLL